MPDRKISENLYADEYVCPHCHSLPPFFYDPAGEIANEYAVLFRAFEQIRARRGNVPLGIARGGGYRCEEYLRGEYEAWVLGGKKGAVHGFTSVHMFGLALDLVAVSKVDQLGIVALARKIIPQPRIGWKQYRDAGILTVHVDYGHLIEPRYSKNLIPSAEW